MQPPLFCELLLRGTILAISFMIGGDGEFSRGLMLAFYSTCYEITETIAPILSRQGVAP